MREIFDALALAVEETINRFTNSHPSCRFALDCNADYGNVYVAVDTSPAKLPLDAFLSESGEEYFWFGDWPIPDLSMEDAAIKALWEKRWSRHEDAIRDDWLDLPAVERASRKKAFLQGICGIAADLSVRLSGIVPPILVADHDEHIRYTTARLRWAFKGPPTPAHAILAHGHWLCKEEKLTHYLGFFHDHEFINHVVVLGDPTCTVEAAGDWRLFEGRLVMTMTETNWKKADGFLWKDVPYDVLSLDRQTLEYREEDGTIWKYEQSTASNDQPQSPAVADQPDG
jgi:hypothetical protein